MEKKPYDYAKAHFWLCAAIAGTIAMMIVNGVGVMALQSRATLQARITDDLQVRSAAQRTRIDMLENRLDALKSRMDQGAL